MSDHDHRPEGLRGHALILLWLGCAPELPERYQVLTGREGDYAIVEAPIPELRDARRMLGDLGDGRVGGYLSGDLSELDSLAFAGGGRLAVEYHVQDGVGVPLHPDGLELFSYYHALSAVRAELDALGIDTGAVFPVPFAYQPSVGGAVLSSNAAYVAAGVHMFVLLPGGFDVPLTANPGVVRHELGHALFSAIVAGDVFAPSPQLRAPEVAALNEGFADMLGTLSLDDPDFITLSWDLGGTRDVRGDATLASAAPVELDPYSRGTVYASFAWDLRELTDPDFALTAAIDALASWAEARSWERGQAGVDAFAARLAERAIAERPGIASALCAAHERRFDGLPRPDACP